MNEKLTSWYQSFVKFIKNNSFACFLYKWYRQATKPKLIPFSGQIAFFMVIAFVPSTLIVIYLLSVLDVDNTIFENIFNNFLPEDVIESLNNSDISRITSVSSWQVVAFLIPSSWIISKAFYAIENLYNTTYKFDTVPVTIVRRITSVFMSLVVLVMVVLTLTVQVFGGQVLMDLLGDQYGRFSSLVFFVKYLASFFMIFMFIAGLMFFSPSIHLKFKEIAPGAIFATTFWLIVSVAFGIYTTHFATYNSIYAGLTSIIIFMLWIYFLANSIYLGIQLNYILSDFYKKNMEAKKAITEELNKINTDAVKE